LRTNFGTIPKRTGSVIIFTNRVITYKVISLFLF